MVLEIFTIDLVSLVVIGLLSLPMSSWLVFKTKNKNSFLKILDYSEYRWLFVWVPCSLSFRNIHKYRWFRHQTLLMCLLKLRGKFSLLFALEGFLMFEFILFLGFCPSWSLTLSDGLWSTWLQEAWAFFLRLSPPRGWGSI